MKDKVVAYINENYNEPDLIQRLDMEILEWLDDDWQDDDDGYDDEYEWYRSYGRGEAEDAIRTQIDYDVLKKFNTTYEEYVKETGQELWHTITEIFEFLDT